MSLPKLEIEKFTIGGDFSLWKMKMKALLVHQGLESDLKEEDPETAESSRSDEKMKHMHNRAHRVERIKIGDEDKAFFLLSSLPKSYEGFVHTMLYERITLTLEDVKASLCSKEIQRHSGDLDQNLSEGLVAKAEKKKKKSKNQDCTEKKRDNKEKSGDAAVASDESSDGDYQSANLLVISNRKIEDKGRVLMGNHNACKIVGIGSVKIRMYDGTTRTLEHVRHVPGLKKNLIPLGMLDSSGYIFKSDHGGLKHGITRHKTVRFTPQQNGLAERMNRTLIDKARYLFLNSKLPRSFWAEAVTIACYLVNMSPSAALKFKTPEEVWTGVSANYKHMRIFGCIAYMHVKVVTFHEEVMLEDKYSTVFDFNPYTNESIKVAAVVKDSKIEVESTSTNHRGDQDMGAIEDLQQMSEVDESRTSTPELHDYQLARDRARRETKPPSRYAYAMMITYVLNSVVDIAIEEPTSYREAVKSSNKSNWIKAMDEEMDSLIKNKTWTLIPNPGNRRLVSSLTDMEIDQMDVKTTFLYGKLEEEILMTQPEDFEAKGKKDCVFHLNKSLYGLNRYDSCVYFGSSSSGGVVYLLLYVDDMLLATKDKSEIKKLKDLLNVEFEMKDLGCAKSILGMDIMRNKAAGTLFVSQERYILKVLDKFDMLDAKFVQTPKVQAPVTNQDKFMMSEVPYAQAVGSLMYVMWIMRYLRGTPDHGLMYGRSKHDENSVVGYVDSDFASDLDGRKSITGYLFMVNGCLISWKATLQPVVTLSLTEAEFVSATEAVKEGKWLSGILNELWLRHKTFTIFCDNQSAIHLIKNQVYHERTNHIDVRLHFIRDEVSKGAVSVSKIHTDVNPADVLTKVVTLLSSSFV
ncbi:hypothetical protein KPL70_017006 [Citrus sinensis]|nr:hypothetical protein KPL70_017006 [Citrus sinensis]